MVQSRFRAGLEQVQSMFRAGSDYGQSMFGLCFISSSCASSVSVIGIFLLGFCISNNGIVLKPFDLGLHPSFRSILRTSLLRRREALRGKAER